MRGDSGDVESSISVLLNKDQTGGGGAMVNGCEYRPEEKACQYNILGGSREKKRGRYSAMEISRDEICKPCSWRPCCLQVPEG